MHALIVEDDENKRLALSAFFGTHFSALDLTVEVSLISAIARARSDHFDLVILDMTLPFYASDRGGVAGTHTFGGEEFLSQLDRFGVTVPVVVFSQFVTFGDPPEVKTFEQLANELKLGFPDLYYGAVYYHASRSDWIDELHKLVSFIIGDGIPE